MIKKHTTNMNTKTIIGAIILSALCYAASAKAQNYGYGCGGGAAAAAAYGNSYIGKAAYQSAQLNGIANIISAAAPILARAPIAPPPPGGYGGGYGGGGYGGCAPAYAPCPTGGYYIVPQTVPVYRAGWGYGY